MNLREVKQAVGELSFQQLVKLDVWLHGVLAAAESQKLDATEAKRQVLKEHKTANKTYQLESVRCGKKNCHCAEGKPHGPYWYAYWTEGGRTRLQYIGKKLPRGISKR